MKQRWSEEEKAALKEFSRERRPMREAAAKLGRPLSSVSVMASRLGLKFRQWDDAETGESRSSAAQRARRFRKGMTTPSSVWSKNEKAELSEAYRQIGISQLEKAIGKSKSAIYSQAYREGVRRTRGWNAFTPEQDRCLIEGFARGRSLSQLANDLQIPKSTVHRRLQRLQEVSCVSSSQP